MDTITTAAFLTGFTSLASVSSQSQLSSIAALSGLQHPLACLVPHSSGQPLPITSH